MEFTSYDITKLNQYNCWNKSDNLNLIESFVSSGMKCAKVENFNHCTAASCAASLTRTIKNAHLFSIKVKTRKGEVFLINTGID